MARFLRTLTYKSRSLIKESLISTSSYMVNFENPFLYQAFLSRVVKIVDITKKTVKTLVLTSFYTNNMKTSRFISHCLYLVSYIYIEITHTYMYICTHRHVHIYCMYICMYTYIGPEYTSYVYRHHLL